MGTSDYPRYRIPAAWKVMWITGASSGLGREIALRLAANGVKVAASARSVEKLAELEAASPNIKAYPLDVTDRAACAAVAAAIARELGVIDLALFNAGVWLPMEFTSIDATLIRQSMEINYFGTTNALEQVLPDMIARKGGHVAIVASVAAYRGLPMAITYAPAKAALVSLAETLYLDLTDNKVKITIINPGFVDTPMTKANTFPMPFIVSTDRAADTMIRGLIVGKYEIIFPWPMMLLAKVTSMLPNKLFFGFIRMIPGEAAAPPTVRK